MSNATRLTNRPICINHGCNTPVVTVSGKITDANPRWRVHCGACQQASWGGKPYKPGVTPWKSGYCRNDDAHLGFHCTVNYKKHPHFIGMTEVDHKNGDHNDNKEKNLDELCPMCHRLKSKLSGDLRQLITGERKHGKHHNVAAFSINLESLMV